MMVLIPFFIIVSLAAIVGPIALGGWVMSTASLALKADIISPLAGIKRMLAARALVELLEKLPILCGSQGCRCWSLMSCGVIKGLIMNSQLI